jgi:hypothetical protein
MCNKKSKLPKEEVASCILLFLVEEDVRGNRDQGLPEASMFEYKSMD